MPSTIETPQRRLAPRQRMARGLARTATGPVDVAYGAAGVGAQTVHAGVVHLRQGCQRIQRAQAARRISAAEVLAGLPQVLEDASRGRVRRPLVFAGVAAVVLVAGGAAVLVIRRSSRPDESSPRPPSVEARHLP
ncbi:MAG: cell wall synthesis protein CwsA [Mycobacterium sp.]